MFFSNQNRFEFVFPRPLQQSFRKFPMRQTRALSRLLSGQNLKQLSAISRQLFPRPARFLGCPAMNLKAES